MEFLKYFQDTLQALYDVKMTVFNEQTLLSQDVLSDFCLSPALQEYFTESGLSLFISNKKADSIYMITDPLDIHSVIFKTGSGWILLGPYVVEEWKESAKKPLLVRMELKGDLHFKYKAYYCAMPVLSDEQMLRFVSFILNNLNETAPREIKYVDFEAEHLEDLPVELSQSFEESDLVNYRYTLESKFYNAVLKGNTEEALKAHSDLRKTVDTLRFISGTLRDEVAGAMAMRTLVRRAALEAGLAPVLIDAVSQEYAQKMHRISQKNETNQMTHDYIVEFCQLIRKHTSNSYSPAVREAIQYISLHLAEPITSENLAQICKTSRQSLTDQFHAQTGKTVKQYLTQMRCEQAADLLENSRLQVQEISRYVGYDDSNYFSRLFKQVTGKTPLEFRHSKKY